MSSLWIQVARTPIHKALDVCRHGGLGIRIVACGVATQISGRHHVDALRRRIICVVIGSQTFNARILHVATPIPLSRRRPRLSCTARSLERR